MSMIHHRTIICFVILCSALISHAQNFSSLPYADSSWTKPYAPFRIAGNLYYVGTYDLACYLITTPKGHILINTGLATSVPMIDKNIESLGFHLNDVRILLTTQGHYDHVAGMAEIKKLTGAKMMVHEGDVQVLEDGGDSDFIFGGKGPMFTPVKVDRVLKDGDEIQIDETKLVVLHHPGHTKGSTSFLLNVKDDKRVWKVLIANIPSILSETNLSGMTSYPQVGKDYRYTLDAMKKLQFDLWVASHASQFALHDKHKPGDAYNPMIFSDRSGYDALVNAMEREYERRLQNK
jgi:metallo-beta-lactamase class B